MVIFYVSSSLVVGAKLIMLKDLRIEGLFACVFDLIIYLIYTYNYPCGLNINNAALLSSNF